MSIDCSVPALWHCWQRFVRGKKRTTELNHFIFYLEANIRLLEQELSNRTYRHGAYRLFSVSDTKRRDIAVASIKDRFLHRFLYEYLVKIYDKTFIHDVWSCREEKGLLKAIERAQAFMVRNRLGYFWRGDVQKFFDSVDHQKLLDILGMRINNEHAMGLLKEVIGSYATNRGFRSEERERESTVESPRGIAIGNVTSQIFANIYLNEFDRYVKHGLRIKKYLRYGDDFVIFVDSREQAVKYRKLMKQFLDEKLSLRLHARNDVIFPCREGLKFLGCVIYPNNRMLKGRVWERVLERTARNNIASYSGLVRAHCDEEKMRHFDWHVLDLLEE